MYHNSPPSSRPSSSLSKNGEWLGVFFFVFLKAEPGHQTLFLSPSLSFLRMYAEMRSSEVSASPCPPSSLAVKTQRFIFPPPFSFFSFAVNSPREQRWRVDGEGGQWRAWGCWERVRGGAARGRLTAEFVSLSCWGGLRTCCSTAAGQTESGSLWGRPAEGGGGGELSGYKTKVHKSGRQSHQRKPWHNRCQQTGKPYRKLLNLFG